ncbi:MAG: thiamine phosphate synthase [Hominisplanchenecus sp.]|nr:thiamine phosphate synthase [Lachnospiraceae bacterium]MDY2818831.1 thiamine phosphate synthase [Hominisplanchenecus sp.]
MCMSDSFQIVCVSNRHLCPEEIGGRIYRLLEAGADMVILREKDLSEAEYLQFARSILPCLPPDWKSRIVLHHFPGASKALSHPFIHLSLWQLKEQPEIRHSFSRIGVSVHSIQEAKEAESLGADYITAGHIFDTACKSGLPGRGLSFLHEVCKSVAIPVLAIGGISPENIQEIRQAEASGACIMSSCMQCPDPEAYLRRLRQAVISNRPPCHPPARHTE